MNEQIQKFAEQAFLFASATDDSDESDANWWKEYNEKFAELIVRDVAKFVGEQRNDIPACGFEFEAAIKEHFGVE